MTHMACERLQMPRRESAVESHVSLATYLAWGNCRLDSASPGLSGRLISSAKPARVIYTCNVFLILELYPLRAITRLNLGSLLRTLEKDTLRSPLTSLT